MFTKKITEADAFTELPPTTQALYFHLCMGADDDGFSNQIRTAMFNAHADRNDFDLLVNKRFIIPFESGVIVIKHWRMHNLIKNDRYKETDYIEERARIVLKKNGVYTETQDWNQTGTQVEPNWNPSGTKLEPQYRIGKEREGKDSLGEDRFDTDCTQPEPADVPPLYLNTGQEWRPSIEDYNEWCELYPNVDVKAEFGRMRQWCISNPTKRKTLRGIRRFAQTWLDREQNKPRPREEKKELRGADAFMAIAKGEV